jgi:sugar phosphate isomerase/epimerase
MSSPLIDVDLDRVFAAAGEVGAHTVVETHVPERFWTGLDDVDRIAGHLNTAAVAAADHGIRIGYHNHWWELERRFDGRTALEALVDRLRPEVVLEVDVYWAAVGGEDVPALLGRLGERVRFLHLKDGPVNHENTQQLPAGRGALPMPEILDAVPEVEAGAVEFDDYAGDIFDGIAASFAYLDPRVSR